MNNYDWQGSYFQTCHITILPIVLQSTFLKELICDVNQTCQTRDPRC